MARQIKSMFNKLDHEYTNRHKEDDPYYKFQLIFDGLVNYLIQLTGALSQPCRIVIAFYIQDCEIFRANSR